MTEKESAFLREHIWNDFCERERKNQKRIEETKNQVMPFGEVKMRYGISVNGSPEKNGYPLYIALHGGGHSDTPDINDSQWEHMKIYYRDSVKNGVYVACRGVRDTWDTHANPESFPLYDELISNMVLFNNVDPNRVYIMGFSAGGDGVYITTPKMADRFAAANMSAGCPNNVKLDNLRNMAFIIQAGERDYFFRRNELIAEYDEYLDRLSAQYGGYYHEANIHFDKAHNFRDNDSSFTPRAVIKNNAAWLRDGDREYIEKDVNAVTFLSKQVRNPYPDRVVWNLSQRAPLRKTDTFYWLGADKNVNEGELVVSYSSEKCKITIEKATAKEFSVYYNEKMFAKEPEIIIDSENVSVVKTDYRPEEIALETCGKNCDPNYIFTGRIDFEVK
ncbi:MAG: hypothetical protein II149_00460 [Clostridia bacterium]|nr:hypothetical protein [Clostridia bacterium]